MERSSAHKNSMIICYCVELNIVIHPQTNGLVERMHATLKAMIRAHQIEGRNWTTYFHTCLLALRTAINDTGVSPALCLYGESILVPGAFVEHPIENKLECGDDFVLELQSELLFLRKYILHNDPVLSGPLKGKSTRIEMGHQLGAHQGKSFARLYRSQILWSLFYS